MKNILIIDLYLFDQPIIEALHSMGYPVIGVLDELDAYRHGYAEGKEDYVFLNKFFFSLNSVINTPDSKLIVHKYDFSRMNPLTNIKYKLPQYLELIKRKNISCIFPGSCVNGGAYLIIGYLNQVCKLPGLNQKLSAFWYRKSRYLNYFKNKGIKTPKLFQTVTTKEEPNIDLITKFPVICKPDCGNGSIGCFLAETSKDLKQFFAPADKNEFISDFEKKHRARLKNGEIANELYKNFHSKYLIQEYISGSILSVMGIKAVNGVEISNVFEIIPSDLPFRSESGFICPFPNKESVEEASDLVSSMVKDSVFPYGPFIIDFVLDAKRDFYLLDVGPRLSAVTVNTVKHSYGDFLYPKRCIQAVLKQKIDIQKRGHPINYVYIKRLPLPAGRLVSFSQKESFSDNVVDWKFFLEPGDKIYEDKNDHLSRIKGELAVKATEVETAKNRWSKEFKKLSFSILPNDNIVDWKTSLKHENKIYNEENDHLNKVRGELAKAKNSEIYAIQLTPDHKNQILDIIQSRKNLRLRRRQITSTVLDRYLDPQYALPAFFGAFQNTKLLSLIGIQKLMDFPYAALTYRFKRLENASLDFLSDLCVAKAIHYARQNGIIAYYVFQRKITAQPQKGDEIRLPENYFSVREVIIPENTRPKENLYWMLMDKQLKPFTGEIRRIMPKSAVLNPLSPADVK